MRPELLDLLCCPEDKAELRLHVTHEAGEEIQAGTLTCTECGFVYPIEQGIPNLLPPSFHVDGVTEAD